MRDVRLDSLLLSDLIATNGIAADRTIPNCTISDDPFDDNWWWLDIRYRLLHLLIRDVDTRYVRVVFEFVTPRYRWLTADLLNHARCRLAGTLDRILDIPLAIAFLSDILDSIRAHEGVPAMFSISIPHMQDVNVRLFYTGTLGIKHTLHLLGL